MAEKLFRKHNFLPLILLSSAVVLSPVLRFGSEYKLEITGTDGGDSPVISEIYPWAVSMSL